MTFSTYFSPGVALQGGGGSSGGGGGTPGGSSGQIQYNSGGAFAGMAGTSWDNTARALTITGYSLTGSASASFMDLAGTWSTSGTPTAIKLNITGADAGSAAGSLLMDLQVGSASRFYVGKTGRANVFDLNCWDGDLLIYRAGTAAARVGTSSFGAPSQISLSNNNPSSPDLYVSRRGAANLRLGAADTTGTTAPTPQFLSAQSWASSTTNNQTGANFTIDGSQGTGTGAGGSIIFRVAPAGGTANGVQNALATALTIGSDRILTVATSASTGVITGPNAGPFMQSASNTWDFCNTSSSFPSIRVSTGLGVHIASDMYFGFNSTTFFTSGSVDVRLYRDTTNTLALRNGAAAQRFNVYNTWTSSTNYETFKIDWITTANTVLVGTEKGSTGGTARALAFQTNGTTQLTIGTTGVATFSGDITTSGYVKADGGNGFWAGAGSYIFWNGRAQLSSPAANVFVIEATSGDLITRFGGSTSSFPALKRSTTFLQARLADDSAFAGFASANMQAATAYTVATLPGTPGTGMIARVTDALAPTIGTTVASGGAAYALVNYNGANWTVIGV